MIQSLIKEEFEDENFAIIVIGASMHSYREMSSKEYTRSRANNYYYKGQVVPRIHATEQYYVMPRAEAESLTKTCLFFSTVDPENDQLLYKLKKYTPVIIQRSAHGIYNTDFGMTSSNAFQDNIAALHTIFGEDCPVYIFRTSKNDGMRYSTHFNNSFLSQDYGIWDILKSYKNNCISIETINVINPVPSQCNKVKELQLNKKQLRDNSDFLNYLNNKSKKLSMNENDDVFSSMMQNMPNNKNNKNDSNDADIDDEYVDYWQEIQPDKFVKKDDVKIWNYEFDIADPVEYRYIANIQSMNNDSKLAYTRSFVVNKPLTINEIYNRLWPEAARRFKVDLSMEKARYNYIEKIDNIKNDTSLSDIEKQSQIMSIPFPTIRSLKFGGEDNSVIDIFFIKKIYDEFTRRNLPAAYTPFFTDSKNDTIQFNKFATDVLNSENLALNRPQYKF